MISHERGLTPEFDPDTGQNIRWVAKLGTSTYSTPVIGGGKVLIGTNNGNPRNDRHAGDRGVLMCFRESDGAFLWQLVVSKLIIPGETCVDWEGVGMVSPATLEGDRVYLVTNRGQVVCLDLEGLANGNDGPFRDEAELATPPGDPAPEISPADADVIWLYDMRGELEIRQHDSAHCSILVHGDLLYICSSNGVDGTHRKITAPKAPSLVVVDKRTGRLVATDNEEIGPHIVHSTWSSPSVGMAAGQEQVFFGGGDGVCYAFRVPKAEAHSGKPGHLEKVWQFDCDPAGPKENIHQYQGNKRISPSNITGMPVVDNGRVYITAGGDYWHGKVQAWLKCIDAGGEGDVTTSRELWSFPLDRHCMSTPSIHNGMIFISDMGKNIYCLDAETSRPHWIHETDGEIWASTLVADGKVFIGTKRGDFWVLRAGPKQEILNRVQFDSAINASPVAANGTLYIATMTHLYAIRDSGN